MAPKQLLLDRYRIIEEIGAGGYGTVQHAYDTRLKRDVAIKCIELSASDVARANILDMEARLQVDPTLAAQNDTDTVSNNPRTAQHGNSPNVGEDNSVEDAFDIPKVSDATTVFETPNNENEFNTEARLNDDDTLFDHVPGLAEARTAAQLNDANIVTMYDCEVRNSTAFVVMEYIEGKTLAQIMQEMGDDISLDVIASVFSSISHALEVAHSNDVLHLDIKPENVIVTDKGVVKVTDFGLATLMDASGQGSAGGGTIGYMPLEQICQEPLDVRTDEWALASLTYEMLSGTNPFIADNLQDAKNTIEDAELVLPSLCWDALDSDADDIIFQALDPDPNRRFYSVADFAEDLMPCLGNTNAGKKILARVVRGDKYEEELPATPEAKEPPVPLIDRLGPKGASVIMRIVAALGAAIITVIALFNIHFSVGSTYGIATEFNAVFWIVLAICVVLAVIRPNLGMLVSFVLFSAMFLFNQAYILGIIMLAITVVWWLAFGRRDDGVCTVALLQPLAGSIGMAPLSPVIAGTIFNVRSAAITTLFSIISAIAFASLGSSDLITWDITTNMLIANDPSVSGGIITDALVATINSPATWCIALSWILAAVEYSLFCEQGSRAIDIAGAVVAMFILIAGVVIATGVEDFIGLLFAGSPDASATVSWLPSGEAFIGALVPGLIGIILAIFNVPDRTRLAEGEW